MVERVDAMQTDFLRYFIKIVEDGSINKAANDLFITQAALTKALKKLETDLDCVLLERTKAGVKLTEKGQRIYADAIKICKIEDSWIELADSNSNITGTVRVAVINSIRTNKFLFQCREKYPGINVMLKEYRALDLLKQFEKRAANIGINAYIGDNAVSIYELAKESGLEVEEFYHDQFYIFMNAQNPLARKEYLEKEDILDLKIVIYSDEKDIMLNTFFEDYFKRENIFFMGSISGMNTAILENHDTVMINTGLYAVQNDKIARGEIVCKKLRDMPLLATYYMLYPDIKRISPAEQIVVNMLRDCMQEILHNIH